MASLSFDGAKTALGFGAIDIVANVHTPEAYAKGRIPVIEPERAMQEVQALNLRPTPLRKILRDNALRVFKLPE